MWTKTSNGVADVYTHPEVGKSIVVSEYGVSYEGKWYESLEEAKSSALGEKDE